MSGKTYLVTGGTGFIGRALVRRLVDHGCKVRVLDNDSRGAKAMLSDVAAQLEIVEGDIRDAACVSDACQDVDVVFHLAFVNGTAHFYDHPDVVLDVGVKGMVNVLDACRAQGVRELFLASSSEVYQTPATVPTDETAALCIPDPLNPRYSYAAGKIISEMMALHHGVDSLERVVIFRPHNVYGPNMGHEHVVPQFIERMHALQDGQAFVIKGTGEETRAFVFIDDFIDGLMLLKDKGAHRVIYHIGTDDEITIKDLALAVAESMGRTVTFDHEDAAKGGTPRRCPDISAMRALGYAPHVSLAEGLSQTIPYYTK